MYDKQNMPTQIRKVLRWKVKQSSHTSMAAANAVGDKIPMFVIGKAQKPRCFKNVKFLPCRNQHKKRLDGWGTV